MEKELKKVDTSRRPGRPRTRHLATTNRIRVPGFAGGQILNGDLAATVCGRYLRDYTDAETISLKYTDGTVWAVECPTCFKESAP